MSKPRPLEEETRPAVPWDTNIPNSSLATMGFDNTPQPSLLPEATSHSNTSGTFLTTEDTKRSQHGSVHPAPSQVTHCTSLLGETSSSSPLVDLGRHAQEQQAEQGPHESLTIPIPQETSELHIDKTSSCIPHTTSDTIMAEPEASKSVTGAGGPLCLNDEVRAVALNKNTAGPLKLMARRFADQDELEHWMRQEQKRINKRIVGSAPHGLGAHAWDDTDVTKLLSSSDKRIISSPREYQVELFERAKEKNIIVVLPTGSGKTLIAALLLRHVIEQEIIDRASLDANEPRISFFLVDKVSLVHQQWKVLRANLAYNVAKFYGELVALVEGRLFWEAQLQENMVIVCTAEILRQCLSHGYIRMAQINLIVFDEAHHAKKNHPYARIMKDFYADIEKTDSRRPRILGMTASPVDARMDLATAAAQLEGLLHADIATIDDPSLMRTTTSQDGATYDRVVEYFLSSGHIETPLWQKMKAIIGHNLVFKKIFTYARTCGRELGQWCADRVWQLCLTPQELSKARAKTEMNYMSQCDGTAIANIDSQIALIEEAEDVLQKHEFVELVPSASQLSHKVLTLTNILQQNFSPAVDKCIVFVEQRLTGVLLADLFRQPSLRGLGIVAGTLLGSATGELVALQAMTNNEQQRAVRQFRMGELNVLITTTVGEEGLDIPDCNMVIRFDLYQTMIQYIQSKGRARMKRSKYFHMVEKGNSDHIQRVFESQEKEEALRKLCLALPEDRLLRGNDFNIDYFLQKEKNKRTYTVPSTGAKLTYELSLVVLATYVSSLANRSDTNSKADYLVRSVGKEFQCEVIMPDTAPVKSAIGRRACSKQGAKCSAAFEMCLKLRKANELDEYLCSTREKHLPAMRNARLALSTRKRAQYNMKIKPHIWSIRGFPSDLFATIVTLQSHEALGRPSRPLALLTRRPLPRTAKFPIFFENQRTSVVHFLRVAKGLDVTSSLVEGVTEFTLRIFRDMFSKEYKYEPGRLPYYFAPLTKNHSYPFNEHEDVANLIDWKCLDILQSADELDWREQPPTFLENRYVVDPHDGSRKFYTRKTRDDLKPLDSQLPGAGEIKTNRARRHAPNDIWNYSVSLWSRLRNELEVRNDLPVVEADYVSLRRNLLDEFDSSETGSTSCYITFATLKISALPVDIVAMAYNLPAIIHRLESNLIVLEAVHALDLDIRPDLALEAMTKNSDSPDEQTDGQVDIQRGMGNNYERLEFLGDSFLKMSTSIALYTKVPDGNEYQYHVDRMILICNKNLFNNALELKLEESIRSKSFNRRTWYPDGLEQLRGKVSTSVQGKQLGGGSTHMLGDKTIADVCEALIGAAYLMGKETNSFDMAVKAVTTFSNYKLENRYHTMKSYDEFYSAFEVPDWQSAEPTAVHIDLVKQIEQKLGYRFTYPRLLRCAFTHPSYGFIYEHIPNYQRLEFLGDALLDMVCVDYLFHRYPGADPQWLTEHKMAMVSNQFLSCLCVSLGLHRHMVSMAADMPQLIASYVDRVNMAREIAEEEAENANRSRMSFSRNFWTSITDAPKCLSDIVEAYIGAIFVDSKYAFIEVQKFFNNHIRPYFENMRLYDEFANKHPVTFLSNLFYSTYRCANWRIMVREMPVEGGSLAETQVVGVVMIHGAVRTHALSTSSRQAKIMAAKKCVDVVENMSIEEYRKTFGCDCKMEGVKALAPINHSTAI